MSTPKDCEHIQQLWLIDATFIFLCGIMCTMPLFIIKCNYEFIIMSFTHEIKLIHNENTKL